MTEALMQSIHNVIDHVIAHRRALHQIPELGLALPETSAYVEKSLRELGLRPERLAGCGIAATLGQGEKTLLLRADMDALQVPEPKTLPFCSRNGNMHACGHDLHTAILLGTAQVLKQHEAQLPCRVKLAFQPGEEVGTGAETMIKDGLLEHPHVDAAAALHVNPDMEPGTCSYCPGVATSAIYDIYIKVWGKGGHSSKPEETVNALAAANGIYNTLGGLIQREVGGFDTGIFALCSMHAGSQQNPNIIPEYCEMAGTLRCFDPELGEYLIKRIREIVEGEAAVFHAKGEVETLLTPSLRVDPHLAKIMAPSLVEILGEDHVTRADMPFSGSEDFSYIAEKVPSFFCWIGAGKPGSPMLHNPDVMFDERALETGVKIMVNFPFAWAAQMFK